MMNASKQAVLSDDGQADCPDAVNPALPVFEATMKDFLTQLDTIDHNVTRKLRQSILAQLSLRLNSLVERQQLNAWITGTTDHMAVNIGLADMQNCIHHAYHYACEKFGPSETDDFLEKALQEAETMPIAKEFSPRKLF